MSLVTFKQDIFPHVKGDVVELDAEEKKRVDGVAKARNLDDAYVAGNKRDDVVDAVDGHQGASVQRATADRAAAKENAVDQAAQLEAQRTAVAEPANVDALGIVAEAPQVVTGTEPVDGVTVDNPNEATDIGSGVGADVKVSKSKK